MNINWFLDGGGKNAWIQGAIRSLRSGILRKAVLPFPLTGDHKDVVREEKGQGGKGLLKVPLKELPRAVSHDDQQQHDLNPGRDCLHWFHGNLSRVSPGISREIERWCFLPPSEGCRSCADQRVPATAMRVLQP